MASPRVKHFRISDLIRLMTMIVTLLVLWMLIVRARDASTWRWLAADDSNLSVEQRSAKEARPTTSTSATAADMVEHKSNASDGHSSRPTDEDDEERAAAMEEFQAVFDGGISIEPEEMHAYRRLLSWVDCQPLEKLKARSVAAPSLNDLMQEPAVHRGELVRLDLHICRALKYEMPDDAAGPKTLYELWGWQEDTQGWLYVAVTPELPAGIPLAERLDERATLYGYFFKLQGYYATGAKPQDRALKAPLFVGRIIQHPSKRAAPSNDSATGFTWIALAVVFAGYLGVRLWVGRRRTVVTRPLTASGGHQEAEEWLDAAQRDEIEESGEDKKLL